MLANRKALTPINLILNIEEPSLKYLYLPPATTLFTAQNIYYSKSGNTFITFHPTYTRVSL